MKKHFYILILILILFSGKVLAQCDVKITNPAPVCFPATVDLTDGAITNGSTPGLNFTYWTDAAAQNPYATPKEATAGTYYIMGDDGAGCTQVQPVVVTVTIPPTASISYAGAPFCRSQTGDQPVTLTGTGAYTGGIFSSSNSGLTIDPVTGAITPSTSTVRTYTVRYTIPASGGCPSVQVTTSVTILAAQSAPVIGEITHPSCGLPTGSVVLSGLPLLSWTITSNPATVTLFGSGSSTVFTGLAPATTYTFTVTNSQGCPSFPSGSVSIQAQTFVPSAPVIGAIKQPTCVDPTISVTLNGLPSPATWTINSNPAGVTQTGNTPTTTITNGLTPGTTYTFTVTSQGCTSLPSLNATINSLLTAPAAPIVGTITQPTCNISTGSVDLSGLPSPGSWTITSTPAGISISGSTATRLITGLMDGTTYTFTVTNSDNCVSPPSASVPIIVQPGFPDAPVVSRIIPPSCSLATGSVVLSGLPEGTWTIRRTPGGVETTGTGLSDTISGIPSGTYSFSVRVSAVCVSAPSEDVVIPEAPFTLQAPLVGSTLQPSCAVSTGSVPLSGLPAGSWTLTRSPDGITRSGSGSNYTYTGLPEDVTYTFTVSNSTECSSVPSAPVLIIKQPDTPTPPTVGEIEPPTCTIPTGSVVFTGLPASGGWVLIRIFSGTTIVAKGTGSTFTLNGVPVGISNYQVKNADSCTSAVSSNVTVLPPPPVLPAPVIGDTRQPVFSDPTGSVELTGLPAGAWVLTRMPGQVLTSGSGTTFIVKPLPIGEYTFTISDATHCPSLPSEMVKISPPGPPELKITDPPTVCSPATVNLEDPSITEGSTTGSIYTYWTDTLATIPYPDYNTAVAGKYFIKATNASGFFSVAPVIVTIDQMPVANAGPDQIIANTYTATLDAELQDIETGVWTVDSGTGVVSDTLNPESDISNLSTGQNIISWKVINGVCPADTDKVILTVGDIILPTLITPNGDTKNEYFVILGIETLGKTELIIFDRRGAQIFKNSDYDNKWNGVDYNENPLPNDTYFFVMNSAKGRIVKGYIVIRR